MITLVSAYLAYQVCAAVDDRELSELHRAAFASPGLDVLPWSSRLERHSLAWVQAFLGQQLVGFVNLGWDGGAHAFLLDTVVHPDHQHEGVGAELVRRAANTAAEAGCEWLHVDYKAHLEPFYVSACGFEPTAAGLLRLSHDHRLALVGAVR